MSAATLLLPTAAAVPETIGEPLLNISIFAGFVAISSTTATDRPAAARAPAVAGWAMTGC